MKNTLFTIFVSYLFISSNCLAQKPRDQVNALRGATILAHQYYRDMDIKKATILSCFALEFNQENEQIHQLIKNIRKKNDILIDERLIDNGLKYSKFLLATLKRMPESSELKRRKSLFAYIIYTINPLEKEILPYLNTTQFKNYTEKIFPDDADPSNKETVTVLKNTIIDIDYRLPSFLPAINQINKALRRSNIKIHINSSRIRSESHTNGNDVLIHTGPNINTAPRNTKIDGISVMEFLNLITHTLALRYEIHDKERTIIITDAHKGQNKHPHYFKKSIPFKNEITKHFFSAQKKYSKKDIQLKGTITKLRDNKKGKLLIEIDHYFVADINISKLKPESISLLQNKLDTYSNKKDSSSKTTDELKFLTVSLRGTCVLKDNKTYITKCTSLIAEEAPFFYTN